MNKRLIGALGAVFIAAMFAVAIWIRYELPSEAQVAIHWGPDGRPDTWIGQWASLLIIPLTASVLWFLVSVFPQGFSSPENSVPPEQIRRALVFRALPILFAVQIVLAIAALG